MSTSIYCQTVSRCSAKQSVVQALYTIHLFDELKVSANSIELESHHGHSNSYPLIHTEGILLLADVQ